LLSDLSIMSELVNEAITRVHTGPSFLCFFLGVFEGNDELVY
jgi:hypothetical protein